MSHFQDRLAHVGTRFDEVNGETVSLRRGAVTVTGKTASPILQMAEEIIPGVAQTRLEYQDWAIDADQWTFGFGPTPPLHRDVVIRADGSEFEVVALNQDEPVFRFTTSDRGRMLVHTVRVKQPVVDLGEHDDSHDGGHT